MSNVKSQSEKFSEAKEKIERGVFFTQLGFGASLFAGGAAVISTPGGPTLGDMIFGAAMLIPAGSTLAYGVATLSVGTFQHFSCKRMEACQHSAPSIPAV